MKTGAKILIGAGAIGVVGYLLYKKFGAQLNLSLPLISEQPKALTPQEKFDKIIEALPAPTKAPATAEQQAQTAKIVAMLYQDTPPPALQPVSIAPTPVAVKSQPVYVAPEPVYTKPVYVAPQPVYEAPLPVKLVTKPVVVPGTSEVLYVASVVEQTQPNYSTNTRTKEYLSGVAI